ncbi:MAG: putative O-glycosylation ligase, exosortase A system-associated [bacterium]
MMADGAPTSWVPGMADFRFKWRRFYDEARPWGENLPEISRGKHLIPVVLFVIALVATYFILYYPPRYTLALWVTLAGLVFIFKEPFWGIVIFYALAFIRPQDIFWGLKDLRLSLMVSGATLLSWLWDRLKRSDWRIVMASQNILILGLWGQMGLSHLFALAPMISEESLIDYSKIFILFFLTINIVKSFSLYRALCWVIVASLGIMALRGVYQYGISGYPFINGPGGTIEDNNHFGLALVMAVPFAYYLILVEKDWWKQLLAVIFALGMVIAIMATFSRGAFLGLILVLGGIFLRARKKLGLLLLGIIFGLGALAALPSEYYNEISSIKSYEEDVSSMYRLYAWRAGWEMIKEYPYTGIGLKHFEHITAQYMKKFLPAGEKNMAAHNSYIHLAAEAGIPALVFFLALLGFSLWGLKRIREIAPRRSPLIYFSYMIELSFWGYIASGFFLSMEDFELAYLLMAMVVALKGIVINKHVLRIGPWKGRDEGYSWT